MTRRALAAGLVAAAALSGTASADPIPGDPIPDPPIHTFCTLHFRPVPIFTDDVPVQPVVPYFAC